MYVATQNWVWAWPIKMGVVKAKIFMLALLAHMHSSLPTFSFSPYSAVGLHFTHLPMSNIIILIPLLTLSYPPIVNTRVQRDVQERHLIYPPHPL